MFVHHPDGRIRIGALVLPLAEFLIEQPGYALPAGLTGRVYDPAKGRHWLSDGENQQGGPMPWPEGEAYLANEATYRASYLARITPLPKTRAEIAAQHDSAAQEVLNGAVHKVVADALWDIELRLRAAGHVSNAPDVAAATTRTEYNAALRARVKAAMYP